MKRSSGVYSPIRKNMRYCKRSPELKKPGRLEFWAEIGTDMSAFPDGDHLSSWGGVCPGNNESAGKKFQTKIRKGNVHLLSALTQCAWAATKKKDCHFRNKYYRLKSRRGSQRAIVAVDHAMLKCVYVVLSQRKPYEEPKPVSLTEAQKQRKASSLCRQLRALGYDVKIQKTA